MGRPRLLDLFCGAGGAAMGYHRAGFDVVGVDIKPQPRYPFEFRLGDAMTWPLDGFDAIHASPPCQDYSKALRGLVPAGKYPRLIEGIRERLEASGIPYVIENVIGAPLPHQSTLDGAHGIELCGTMFQLRVQRHRLFETSFPLAPPRGCDHSMLTINPYSAGTRAIWFEREGWRRGEMERRWREEMGLDWTGAAGSESFPVVFTEYVGWHLREQIPEPQAAAQGTLL